MEQGNTQFRSINENNLTVYQWRKYYFSVKADYAVDRYSTPFPKAQSPNKSRPEIA